MSLWIGDSLGPVERACLRSVVRQGHPLALYCYDRPAGLPDGIEVRDAEAVIPRERIIRHKSGSPALFANRFRYELQRRCAGIWVDCDIYLLAPLPIDEVYLMGKESPGSINNGVLRLPSDSPLLPPLLALFDEKEVPWWLPWRARMAAHARLRWTGRTNLGAMPWGSAGPVALSALARKHGLYDRALPREVLYPVHWTQAEWILDPAQRLEERVSPRTLSIHLFNERIRRFKDKPAPAGSFLARLQDEGAC